jgi:hypothetical protein
MDREYGIQQHAGAITGYGRFSLVHTKKFLRRPYVENMYAVPVHSDCSTTFLHLGTARLLMGHIWDSERIPPVVIIVGK